jgi:hypothetical protein
MVALYFTSIQRYVTRVEVDGQLSLSGALISDFLTHRKRTRRAVSPEITGRTFVNERGEGNDRHGPPSDLIDAPSHRRGNTVDAASLRLLQRLSLDWLSDTCTFMSPRRGAIHAFLIPGINTSSTRNTEKKKLNVNIPIIKS